MDIMVYILLIHNQLAYMNVDMPWNLLNLNFDNIL